MASRIKEGIKDLFSSKDDLDYPSGYTQQRIFVNQRALNGAGPVPVLELRVPMCCEKCEEKVKEAVEECDGVKNVICDQYNQRVTVTGFVDPLKVLRRVRKVKKKSEFFRDGTLVTRTSHPITQQSRSMHVPPVSGVSTRYTANPLVRTHSSGFGRFPHEGQMSPMAPPVVVPAPVVRRQLPLQRHNALVPVDLRRDFTGIRRMPSFRNYRNHDAEYIAMADEYMPPMAETRYVSHHNQRPVQMLRPQLSFSRIPVTNPHYLKHIESEYY
jgi:copper chaperone CopZ